MVEKDFIKYLKGARAEFSREILKMAPHENPNRTEEQTRLRVVAEDMLIAFDKAVDKLTEPNTPNNTALTAEPHRSPEYYIGRYVLLADAGNWDELQAKIVKAMQEHTASALAEKDREIERLKGVILNAENSHGASGLCCSLRESLLKENEKISREHVGAANRWKEYKGNLESQLEELTKTNNNFHARINEDREIKDQLRRDLQSTRDMCERFVKGVTELSTISIFGETAAYDMSMKATELLDQHKSTTSQEGEKTT